MTYRGTSSIASVGAMPSDIITALLAATGDSDGAVAAASSESLARLGASDASLTLGEAIGFLKSNWLGVAHREQVLRTASTIVRAARSTPAAGALVTEHVESAIDELVRCSASSADGAAAEELLAALGEAAPAVVLGALLARCLPGELPPSGVLRSLGELASASPAVCVPAVKAQLLPRLLPLLGAAQGEVRAALAHALHHIAQAIAALGAGDNDDDDGTDAAGGAAAAGGGVASGMQAAIELLHAQWLTCRSDAVRFAAAEAVGSMMALLPAARLRPQLSRLLPGLLGAHKRERPADRLPATQAVWATLVACEARDLGREIVSEQQLLPTLAYLRAAICAPLERSSGACLRVHNEELRCIEVLARP